MATKKLLDNIYRAVDKIIESGKPYHGLFPSLLNRETGKMLEDMPDPIPGQRNGDRSHPGCNLIHDEPLLKMMYILARVKDKKEYQQAADSYLKYFAIHCTDTETGLFPWGEHSYWNIKEDKVGGDTHDHLRQVSLWLWEKISKFNSDCVQRFADGLNYHWVDCQPREYIRHASIKEKKHPEPGPRSCDFPRHSGFYIFDWVFAYTREQRQQILQQIKTMVNYWWEKKDQRGLLLIESRSPEGMTRFYRQYTPPQTISLVASLCESAELIKDLKPEIADTMLKRADKYIDGFFKAPHNVEQGLFVNLCGQDDSVKETMSIWGSVYGTSPAAAVALICLCAYRYKKDERLLQWALAVGREYLQQPFPEKSSVSRGDRGKANSDRTHLLGHHFVPAKDAGLVLELSADLYEITGDSKWLDWGLELTEKFINIYFDRDLPRGAAGIDWYESQLGPGFLIHGISRIVLIKEGIQDRMLTPNYTQR